MAHWSGLPRWAGNRKVKPIWILLKLETVRGSGIHWPICMSAPRSRQITTLAPHHSVFYRPEALPATQPTASMHWRQLGIQVEFYHYLFNVIYSDEGVYGVNTTTNESRQTVNVPQTTPGRQLVSTTPRNLGILLYAGSFRYFISASYLHRFVALSDFLIKF